MGGELRAGAVPLNSLVCRAARDRRQGGVPRLGKQAGIRGRADRGKNTSEVSECVQRCSFAVP